ncbi:MarR family transcriptional regulator [Clostridium sp. BNL1100]|uniref:MarR family winged helix-turn-helix transcriptional regulator n=1 Tax=Clostridium sp. BNL1100 TaxID=755731 RepID=UPI00024A71D2|nr:MarR family transcriptional regulator [Clostridium sp. BNL1100]AEY67626.1 transcriptional regulator [Clostridium sp. BNL1100]
MINQGSETLRELIRILVRDLGILEKSDASCCGVTITQCHAVVEIGRKGKISLVDLAGLLGLDKSTMSRTINNLVESDLVLRDLDSENRRYVIIQLTENGRNVFKNIEESMNGYYKSIFNSIPENKRSQVMESLQLLTNAVESNKCC